MIEQNNLLQYLQTFFDQSNEIIFFLDDDGNIIYRNKASQDIVGKELQSQLDKAICTHCEGFTDENNMVTCIGCFLSQNVDNKFDFQIFMTNKDGTVQPYSANYQTLTLENDHIRMLRLNTVSGQIKTQQQLHQKILTKRIMEAQEDERKRISRELHDSTIQSILSILVEVRLFKYTPNEALKEKISNTEGLLNDLIKSVRDISVDLRPSSLDDLGLLSALQSHFSYIQKNYGITMNCKSNISDTRYATEIETAVYRIVQEAVFNAVKYANVDEIDVSILKDKSTLSVMIHDEGQGFDEDSAPQGSGLGLYGMRERAENVGGTLKVRSIEGHGTTVTLNIPFQEEQ